MEGRIRPRTLRAVVGTSALEAGIDMPDPDHGSNSGLPPTREHFHQRMGRVDRARPAHFVISGDTGPSDAIPRPSETLRDHCANGVEESCRHLYNS